MTVKLACYDKRDISSSYLTLIHLVVLYDALTAFANDATGLTMHSLQIIINIISFF